MARKPTVMVKCKFCGMTGRPKSLWRGSKSLERFIWLTLLLPGPLYTYYRWSGRKQVCAHCESENIEIIPPAELPETVKKAVKDEDLGYEEHRF